LIKSEKNNKVSEIKEDFKNNTGLIFADQSKMKSEQSAAIRDRLYEVDATLKITKNTLASIAASEVYKEIDLSDIFKGPTSIVISHKDIIAAAKVVKDVGKEMDVLKIKAGIVEGKLINAADVMRLANLPSREVLITQIVAAIASPLYKLVSVLNNLPQKLVLALSAVKEQKEQTS